MGRSRILGVCPKPGNLAKNQGGRAQDRQLERQSPFGHGQGLRQIPRQRETGARFVVNPACSEHRIPLPQEHSHAVLLGLIPAVIACKKGRSFVGWWLYGALLFIVALPHALLARTGRGPLARIARSRCGGERRSARIAAAKSWRRRCSHRGRGPRFVSARRKYSRRLLAGGSNSCPSPPGRSCGAAAACALEGPSGGIIDDASRTRINRRAGGPVFPVTV